MKKTILFLVCVFAVTAATAQKQPSNKYANWFVSAAGGVQFFQTKYSDINTKDPMDHWSPNVEASVGKWFTPVWGARLTYDGLQLRALSDNRENPYYEFDRVDGKNELEFRYFGVYADLLFNPLAANCPNSRRFYEFIPYVGIGVASSFTFDNPHLDPDYVQKDHCETVFSGHFGIINRFRICKALDFNINLNGKYFTEKFDLQQNSYAFGATAGFTYKF